MNGLKTSINGLLQPIPGGTGCGEDIWLAESRYQLLQPIEQAWRNGEEASWSEIEQLAHEHLSRSRDLRTAVILCLARLKSNGLAGFQQGLVLIHDLLERFGDQIHPLPARAGDDIRQNTLSNLSAPLGNDTPYQFVKYLRHTALCRSSTGTQYTLADVLRAEGSRPDGRDSTESSPDLQLIEATFRAAPRDQLDEVNRHVAESLGFVDRIENLSGTTDAPLRAVSLEALKGVLTEIKRLVETYGDPVESATEQNNTKTTSTPADLTPGVAIPAGGIRSRKEVDAALAAVCEYLRRNEPSSPVPFLIERARRLLRLDFLDSMRDLAPDSIEKFNLLFGLTNKETT